MKPLNWFAASEQGWQERFRELRNQLLAPLLRILTRCGIRPNWVSATGLLILIPFTWLFLRNAGPESAVWALVPLLAHLVLDGIDGPLARYQGRTDSVGSLVDMVCDHLAFAWVCITLVHVELLHRTWGCLYILFYTLAIVQLVLLNQLGRPFRFVVRTKMVLYGLVALYGLAEWNGLPVIVPLCVASEAVTCILAFLRIYRFVAEQSTGQAS
jgi:phosphatidylglycerophosphate synthase